MKKYLKNQKKVLEGKILKKWRDLVASFLLFKNKNLALLREKLKNKDKIIKKNIPKEVIIWSIIGIIASNLIFYNQSFGKEFAGYLSDKSVFASISNLIYEMSWEKGFEMEELRQDADLSKIKEERANKVAQEEIIKRDEAEVAKKEAEIAKKEAEEKTRQEAIRRSQAEAKAKQEEFERKLKEQQLSEKEAEERRMNADNDGDGLTYRQELEFGTSDLNPDSDSDGIIDSEDLHPAGDGKHEAQYFEWEYAGKKYNRTFHIHEDWERYYKNKPRGNHGLTYFTPSDPFIQSIAEELKNTADREGHNLTLFVIAFVQHIPYVYDFYTSFAEYPKYPVETIIDRNGDCEDTAYAAASIVSATGIGIALLEFDNHMALGVWGEETISGYYYEADGKRFYYVETTSKNYALGDIPDGYNYKQAKITPWNGDVSYGYANYEKPCNVSSAFSGYYTDGNNYYSDSQCNNLVYCIVYKDFYWNYKTEKAYWDSSCSQLMVSGCSKSTSYSGYFTDGSEYYYDSRCTQTAKICRVSTYYPGQYWDGYDFYWDSNCNQKVLSWCIKATSYPGYFFSGLDYEYYYDNQCTQKADVY